MTSANETVTNYSELNTLAMCERRWAFGYEQGKQEEGKKVGLHRGTLLHLGKGRWSTGLGATLPERWEDDMGPGGRPGEQQQYSLADFDPDVVESARWLLDRFAAHYGDAPPPDWKLLATEPWLSGMIGGEKVVGRADNLWEIDGRVWLDETKSFGSKGRADFLAVDPQVSIYYTLVKQTFGLDIFGIMWDGIYTYRYAKQRPTQAQIIDLAEQSGQSFPTKKAAQDWARAELATSRYDTEQPPELSFQREWLDRTPLQIEAQGHAVRAAVARMEHLREVDRSGLDIIERTMPNIGQTCKGCGHKNRCWAQLLGEPEYAEYGDDE